MQTLSLPFTQDRQVLSAETLKFLDKTPAAVTSALNNRVWIILEDAVGNKSRNRWVATSAATAGGNLGIAEHLAGSVATLLKDHAGTVYRITVEFN